MGFAPRDKDTGINLDLWDRDRWELSGPEAWPLLLPVLFEYLRGYGIGFPADTIDAVGSRRILIASGRRNRYIRSSSPEIPEPRVRDFCSRKV